MFYRLRRFGDYARFRLATRGIRVSPPIPCGGETACEIHTMLSREDLPLYLVAIKSFLRFYRNVGVVVHSDGTLDDACAALLARHVPGCRFVPHVEANRLALDRLGADSALYRCRSYDASYRRLVDTELCCRAPSRIIMDADILVIKDPVEVIDWIEGRLGLSPFLMGQPPRAPREPAPFPAGDRRHIQTVFKERLEEVGRALGETARFLDGTTGGFYGCRDQLSLKRIEQLLVASEGVGIPMTKWGGEQCMVIYLLSCEGARRLDPDKYFNFFRDQEPKIEGANLIHFIGTDRFDRGIYTKKATEVVRQLGGRWAASRAVAGVPQANGLVSSRESRPS
jgi:hypothetical protein